MKSRKILIADDDRHVRTALRTRLTDWGYAVVESSNGLGVLANTTREGVDALILDHNMPLGEGRDIARIIRQETDAPIIFLSGHDRMDFRDTVMTLADVYFLPKPLNARHLEELLQACLAACPVIAGGVCG